MTVVDEVDVVTYHHYGQNQPGNGRKTGKDSRDRAQDVYRAGLFGNAATGLMEVIMKNLIIIY